jgi:uncharacterized protein YndB with AHSA1/START domain
MSTTTTTENDTLTLTRLFKAPRERVFTAFTSTDSISQWFGCGHVKVISCTADFCVGGSFRIEARGLESEEAFSITGVYREITPPAKVAYTWTYPEDPDWAGCESLVSVEFKAIGDQTELTLTHTGFPSAESHGNHSVGWGACLDKIDSLLTGGPASAC